jgi:glycosyltransferase involved in cell wall biosynthesis
VSKINTDAPHARLERIGYGVDLNLLRPHSDKAKTDARRVLGLPQDGRIVLYFGRVTPHSKADLMPLLRCFAEASDDARHYLLIAGSPSPQSYLQKLREAGDALGLADRLIIHGEVGPQLPAAYYGAADAFVFPSDNPQETWGQTMCEAMASGLPVIASDWDGLPLHVEHEKNGFLIPRGGCLARTPRSVFAAGHNRTLGLRAKRVD